MRNLFLVFTVIVLFLLLKEAKTKVTRLQRVEVNSSQVVDFSGSLFLPRTLHFAESLVNPQNPGVIILHIGKDLYSFRRIFPLNTYYLETGTAREVEIRVGEKIRVDFSKSNVRTAPVKLMVLKDL